MGGDLLIDRVFPIAGINSFNQGTRTDTSSFSHFKQAWSELYRASYIKNFASIHTFKKQLQNKNYAQYVVPIGIINTEFHQCNFGATFQNANVTFNPSTGVFSNKSGRIPFVKSQVTIVAPLVSQAAGNQIAFTTDAILELNKQGKRIKYLRIHTNKKVFSQF